MTEVKQTIAVLGGTGNEGAGLALRWAMAGHKVLIGSRDAAKAQDAAERLAERTGGDVSGHDNAGAAAAADIVVLAVPYAAQQATAMSVKDQLAGKILIDVTVPLVPPKVARVQLPDGGSAVEVLQAKLGDDVDVVAAFQNISAHQLDDPEHTIECDVLVAGDKVAARETVCALIEEIGIRAIHAGPLANSAAAEALTSVLISINKRYKIAEGAGIRITGIPDGGA